MPLTIPALIFALLVFIFNYRLVANSIEPEKRWYAFAGAFVKWHFLEGIIAIVLAGIISLLSGWWSAFIMLITDPFIFCDPSIYGYLLIVLLVLYCSSGLIRYIFYDRPQLKRE